VACIAVLWVVQDTIWSGAPRIHGTAGRIWNDLDWLWLAQLPASLINLTGLLMYSPSRKDRHADQIAQFVCWRIVSRGTNTEALAGTIRRVQAEMQATPLFRYVIEVVTDIPNPLLPQGRNIVYLVVPEGYQTPKGSKFKARALQYAVEHSPLRDTSWIVHLDEESRPVPSGIRGVARMINEEERSGRLRIGQGAILYHRSWRTHPFLTLADMPRTGDDLGRFYLAYRTGVTLFGMHGSFIVVRNDVEKAAGFDFGPVGSITEDAFWALCEMEAGQRVRWVDGYMEEQSTQSIMDLLKQRRRWFQGIVKVCLFAPVHWKWRITFSLSTLLWATAPLGMAYTLAHLLAGGSAAVPMRALGDFALAGCVTVVIAGLRVNMDEHGIFERTRRLFWYALVLPAICLAWLLEAVGVGYALVSPGSGFHVVKK
jgi:egghead protein (zeste-white 4 protein)